MQRTDKQLCGQWSTKIISSQYVYALVQLRCALPGTSICGNERANSTLKNMKIEEGLGAAMDVVNKILPMHFVRG